MRFTNKFILPGYVIWASAILHLPVLALDFAAYGMAMIAVIAVYAVLGLGLTRGMRWVGWISFLVMLVGLVAALVGTMDNNGILSTLFAAILALDIAAALLLFRALWFKDPKPAQA